MFGRHKTLDQRYLELQQLAKHAQANPEPNPWPRVQDTAWRLLKDCQPVLDSDERAPIVALAAARIAVVPEAGARNWHRLIAIGWIMSAAVAALDHAAEVTPRPGLLEAVARDLYRRADLIGYAAHRAGVPAAALLAESLTSIRLGDRGLRRSMTALLDRSHGDQQQVVRTQRTQLRDVVRPFAFDGEPEQLNAWFEQQIRSDFSIVDVNRAGARVALTGGTSAPLEAMRLTGRSLLYLCAGIHGGAAILFDASALDDTTLRLATSVELPDFDLGTIGGKVTDLHEIAARRRGRQVPGTSFSHHVEELLAWLGATVWTHVLKAWPQLRTRPLSVVPVGESAQLPLYTALVDDQPVCSLVDLTIAPSARSLVLAGEHPAADGPVLVAADPAAGEDEISCVVEEACLVADVYGITPDILREPGDTGDHDERLRSMSHQLPRDAAAPASLLWALRHSAVLHLACHGVIQPERPLESALLLGGAITVGSILSEDLLSGCLIVLSACDLAGIGTDAPGEQLGFPAVLLAGGARSVVAALWPVPDAPRTARLMKQFHEELARHQPGRALAVAVARAHKSGAPASLWAPLVCFGA